MLRHHLSSFVLRYRQWGWAILLATPLNASAAELRVAVAANFKHALDELAAQYSAQSNHQVRVSAGSSGALYTQILHGAPYDLFFSADEERPARLVALERAVAASQVTYASGVLAFWTPRQEASEALLKAWQPRLSIANPRIAPYGVAAQETLTRLRPNDPPPLVRGGNILQAYQYVQSGNAAGGLVALSHLIAEQVPPHEYWPVPSDWYQPIEQQAVVLTRSAERAVACDFLGYVLNSASWLQAQGYVTEAHADAHFVKQCQITR